MSKRLDQSTALLARKAEEYLKKLAETGDKIVDIAAFSFLAYYYSTYLTPGAPLGLSLGHSSIIYLLLKSQSDLGVGLGAGYLGFKALGVSGGVAQVAKRADEIAKEVLEKKDAIEKTIDEVVTRIEESFKPPDWDWSIKDSADWLKGPDYQKPEGPTNPDLFPDDEDLFEPVPDRCLYQKYMTEAKKWRTLDSGDCAKLRKRYSSTRFGMASGYRIVKG